jgi:hypothetical protein
MLCVHLQDMLLRMTPSFIMDQLSLLYNFSLPITDYGQSGLSLQTMFSVAGRHVLPVTA